MTILEIKEFIEWAKSIKLKHYKCSEFEFELSDLSFIEDMNKVVEKEMVLGGSNDMLDTLKASSPEENDEDLFWSTK